MYCTCEVIWKYISVCVCVCVKQQKGPCRQFHTHQRQEQVTKLIWWSKICKRGPCFTQDFLYPGHTPRVLPYSFCVCAFVWTRDSNPIWLPWTSKLFRLMQHLILGTVQVFLDCLTCSQHLRGLLRKRLEGSRRRELGRMSPRVQRCFLKVK